MSRPIITVFALFLAVSGVSGVGVLVHDGVTDCSNDFTGVIVKADGGCHATGASTSVSFSCTGTAVTLTAYGSAADCTGAVAGTFSGTDGQCMSTGSSSYVVTCSQDVITTGVTTGVSFAYQTTSACDTVVTNAQSGQCNTDGTNAANVMCASASADSFWRVQLYSGATVCTGTPSSDAYGYGSSCNPSGLLVNCAGAGCYSSESTVVLESGVTVPYSDVKVGDKVLSVAADGAAFFDKVFRVTHWDTETVSGFVRITTATGQVLELTQGHMLPVGSCCDVSNLAYAASVKVGDTVFVVPPGRTATEPSAVVSVEHVNRAGSFNAHTLHGTVVVNGVVGTHFTSASKWSDTARAWAPYWYHAADAMESATGLKL